MVRNKAGERRGKMGGEPQHFEQRTHFVGVRQAAMRGDVAFEGGTAEAGGERLGVRGDAKVFEEAALGGDGGRRAERLGGAGECDEIDMRGQVGVAGIGEGIREAVVFEGLEGIAQGGARPVINEQGGAAMRGEDFADAGDNGGGGRAGFDDVAGAGIGEAMGEGGMGGGWREAGAQVRGFDTDHHFAPCVARGAVKLADRQGIEEFIGNKNTWKTI